MTETDQLTDGQLIDLPLEAGDVNKPRFEPNNDWLRRADRLQQKTAMWRWLATNYAEPDVAIPHDTEGNYLFLDGGPFLTQVLLQERFEGLVPDGVIQELIHSVRNEVGDHWAERTLDRFGG